MTPELPVALPPPYKDRRGWLIAFGIVEILVGALNLLIIGTVLVAFLVIKAPIPNQPGSLSPAGLLTVTEVIYGGLAAFFITVGIGSIRCRNWARLTMIIASAFWLCVGTLSTIVMVLILPRMPRPASAASNAQFQVVFAITMVVVGFIFVCVPAIFLIFYTRKSVKATCLARSLSSAAGATAGAALAAAPAPNLPVPVIILVVFEALGTTAVLAALIRPATVLFGKGVSGFPAVLILLAYSLVAGLAAWLVYHRDFTGWVLAVAKLCFSMTSFGVTLAVRGWTGVLRDMGGNLVELRFYDQFHWLVEVIWIGALVFSAAYLIFLLYARKYFLQSQGEATGAP